MHNKNGRKWIKELGVEKFLKVSNDDEALAAMEFYDSPDAME